MTDSFTLQESPELWEEYRTSVREYKERDHSIVYARLANSPEKVVNEKHFLRSLPDSLDIVTLTNAAEFSGYDADFTVAVDEALVGEYNARYGISYEMLPAKYCEFPSVQLKIQAGRTMSETASVMFKGLMGEGDEQTGAMDIDHTYLLPVRLSSTNMELMQAA